MFARYATTAATVLRRLVGGTPRARARGIVTVAPEGAALARQSIAVAAPAPTPARRSPRSLQSHPLLQSHTFS